MELTVLMVLLVLKGQPVLMVQQVHKVLQEQELVYRVLLAHKVLQVQMVLRDR